MSRQPLRIRQVARLSWKLSSYTLLGPLVCPRMQPKVRILMLFLAIGSLIGWHLIVKAEIAHGFSRAVAWNAYGHACLGLEEQCPLLQALTCDSLGYYYQLASFARHPTRL